MYELLLNHLFQRNQGYDGWKEPQNNDKVITWNKEHLLKQVVPVTHTLEKKFSVATFEGLWVAFFHIE